MSVVSGNDHEEVKKFLKALGLGDLKNIIRVSFEIAIDEVIAIQVTRLVEKGELEALSEVIESFELVKKKKKNQKIIIRIKGGKDKDQLK